VTDPRRPRAGKARLAVDLSAALNLVGALVRYLGLASLLPAAFAVAHDEPAWPFLVAGLTVSGFGLLLERVTSGRERMGIREGYLVASLTWLVAAVYGALPYVLANDPQLGRPLDALFEGMSGLTTTGASVATDVEALPVSIQIWRQLTVWLGGIGVVALGLAVLTRLRVGGRQLLETDLAGPEDEGLTMRLRDTVRRFWLLYLGMTAVGFVALVLPGLVGVDDSMTPFDAFAHALTTVGTGGFSTQNDSIGASGATTQWIVLGLMAVAGANLVLLYRTIVQRRGREAARDEELRLYLVVLVGAAAAVTISLWGDGLERGEAAIRAAAFETTSVITTTGYYTSDYSVWPTFSLMAIALLFFAGGCANSTTGSIKIVRHLLLGRILGREIERTVRPELVRHVRLNATVVDRQVLAGISAYVLLYLAVFVLGTGILAVDAAIRGTESTTLELVFAGASTLGNAGVGLGPAGPGGSFAAYDDVSTLTMTALMWIGRLEIIPVVVLLSRRYWRV
jgi:trk system potassium uptake protein TrkH